KGLNNGIQFLEHPRFARFKSRIKEAFRKIEPLLTLVLMVALLLGLRLVGEMLVVPGQHERIDDRLRDEGQQLSMNGCGLLKTSYAIVKMRSNRFQQLRQAGIPAVLRP